ncbi:MAG: hypothetical protein HY905_02150 [Deltaproteobacteria bacterium]|nr:hypothetical protein [Deltaproteobacteria bacterium]
MGSWGGWIRGRLAEREHRGHGVYLVRLGGILVGLALAVAFYAAALGGRLADAEAEARRRAPGAAERDVGLAALVKVRYGLDVDANAVAWVGADEDLGVATLLDPSEQRRAVFAASAGPEAARDVFVADVALADDTPVRISQLRNLTESPAADEADLVAAGDLVAFVRWVAGEPPTVIALDMAGQDASLTESWPAIERWKDAVTNFQEVGRFSGMQRLEVRLAAVPRELRLSWASAVLTVDTGDGRVVVDLLGRVREGAALVAGVTPTTKAIRGHVAWAVDTAREWVGAGPIETLEYFAFRFADELKQATVSTDEATAEIERSLAHTRPAELAGSYHFEAPEGLEDVDLGWPPPDITPPGLHGRMAGEGEWTPMLDDDFVLNEAGAPPTFYTTFLRTDPERPFSVVYAVLWDPRRATLHPSGGSIEPKAATGETSTGMVPRDDPTIRRFVAGFNGGFQALHGEFGLFQDGTMYLPPKAWGGMVFLLRGGRAAVGTWPGPDETVALYAGGATYEQDPDGVNEKALEEWFGEQGVVSFRQNLTPLFGHGQINPYGRKWWGSSPKDLDDPNPVTVRSAICWTQRGHMGYFYGLSTNLDALVSAMELAECRYGLHLDMNGGNVGWEFYRVVDAGTPASSGMRAGFQAEGEVPGRTDLRFRARGLFEGMDIFRFPRYVQREPRDFFYLVLEENLPTPDVPFEGGGEEDGKWSQRGLPARSYPPAMVFTSGPADASGTARVYLLALDPRWMAVSRGPAASTDAPSPEDPPSPEDGPRQAGSEGSPVAAFAPVAGSPAVWRGDGPAPFAADDAVVVLARDPLGLENLFLVERWADAQARLGGWPVVLVLRGEPLSEASTGAYAGAFGSIAGKRFLLYAEAGSGDGPALYRALRAAGAERIVGVSRSDALGWVFLYGSGEGERRPLTRPELSTAPVDGWAEFSPAGLPAVLEVLQQTQVVAPGVWNPPHTRRIRYFRTDDQRARPLRSY